jgi:8-oxo-dGTP pyrophosphatase MutT (NUDIX family)
MAPVREAATVVLVRDADRGVEVFMLRRSHRLVFTPGAYVFPGGAVDPEDAALARYCAGRDDTSASRLLGIDGGGLVYWVAAVRECFEECGVLFTRPPVRGVPAGSAPAGGVPGRTLLEICRDEGALLDVGALHYFAHWLTPRSEVRRYNTRFFVAAVPPGQEPAHDDGEAVEGLWLQPAEALARWPGERQLIRPTRETLTALARFGSVAALLDALAAAEAAPAALPRMGADEAGVRVPLPGDEGWAAVQRA